MDLPCAIEIVKYRASNRDSPISIHWVAGSDNKHVWLGTFGCKREGRTIEGIIDFGTGKLPNESIHRFARAVTPVTNLRANGTPIHLTLYLHRFRPNPIRRLAILRIKNASPGIFDKQSIYVLVQIRFSSIIRSS